MFPAAGATAQPPDGKWRLVEAYGKPLQNSAAYLEIVPREKRFSGHSGCNHLFGRMSLTRNRIDLSEIGMTKMACGRQTGEVPEYRFVAALDAAARYKLRGEILTFFDRSGRKLLKLRREGGRSVAETGLADKKWLLESFAGERGRAYPEVFVNFDEGRSSAGGNTGCNVFGGGYTATENWIAISDVISTMRACEEGDKMAVERRFLEGLRSADRFEIAVGKLRLYRDRELLMTLRGVAK